LEKNVNGIYTELLKLEKQSFGKARVKINVVCRVILEKPGGEQVEEDLIRLLRPTNSQPHSHMRRFGKHNGIRITHERQEPLCLIPARQNCPKQLAH